MNISEINQTATTIEYAIEIEPADYFPQYKKQLKEQARTISMPGFRPGNVPVNLVQRRYGESILYHSLNKLAIDSLTNYLKENQVQTILKPVFKPTDITLDAYQEKTYRFELEIAKYPEFEIQLEDLPNIPKFEVELTEDDINGILENICFASGKTEPADIVEENSIVEFRMRAVNEDGSYNAELFDSLMNGSPRLMSEARKAVLLGKKVGEKFPLKLDMFGDTDEAICRNINFPIHEIDKLKATKLEGEIISVKRQIPAELTLELLQSSFEGEPKQSIEEYKEIIKKEFQEHYQREAMHHFAFKVQSALLRKYNFEIPYHILLANIASEHNYNSYDEVFKKHPNFELDFRLAIINQKLAAKYPGLRISDDVLKSALKQQLTKLFFQPSVATSSEMPVQETVETELSTVTELTLPNDANSGANDVELQENDENQEERVNELVHYFMQNKETVSNQRQLLFETQLLAHMQKANRTEVQKSSLRDFDYYRNNC
ncbi:MAG: hypothetical protein NZ108_08365 [Bacteroidia bacterium]|nr:hypothetical protein [Bacteroidia bacterium]